MYETFDRKCSHNTQVTIYNTINYINKSYNVLLTMDSNMKYATFLINYFEDGMANYTFDPTIPNFCLLIFFFPSTRASYPNAK